MAEPVVETGRADARLAEGCERSIVKLGAEVARVGVGDDSARICLARRNRRTSSSSGTLSGPAISIVPLTGAPSVASATASATSSDMIGCNSAGDRRTVCPSVADCAMPFTNSKNCVERTIVYGIPDALIRRSCAILARR